MVLNPSKERFCCVLNMIFQYSIQICGESKTRHVQIMEIHKIHMSKVAWLNNNKRTFHVSRQQKRLTNFCLFWTSTMLTSSQSHLIYSPIYVWQVYMFGETMTWKSLRKFVSQTFMKKLVLDMTFNGRSCMSAYWHQDSIIHTLSVIPTVPYLNIKLQLIKYLSIALIPFDVPYCSPQ